MYNHCIKCNEKLRQRPGEHLFYCVNPDCHRYGLVTVLGTQIDDLGNIRTPFIHAESGLPVVVSKGRGFLWSVYLLKPDGSLQKCELFAEYRHHDSAELELDEYEGNEFKRV